jgi:hypothetical protein
VLTGHNSGTVTGLSGGFYNMQALVGQGANNTLTGSNNVSTWNLTSSNSGTVSYLSNGFNNMQNLIGGSAADTFNFVGGTLTGSIDGGADVNSIAGDNVTNVWHITGVNSGTFSGIGGSFSQIQSFRSGSMDNTFIFADGARITGIIFGYTPANMAIYMNTIDYSAYTTSVNVSLSSTLTGSGIMFNSTFTPIAAFTNINDLAANDPGNNSLTLPDELNQVVVTAPHTGYINDPIYFTGIESFIGTGANNVVNFTGSAVTLSQTGNTIIGSVNGIRMFFYNFTTNQFGIFAPPPAPVATTSTTSTQVSAGSVSAIVLQPYADSSQGMMENYTSDSLGTTAGGSSDNNDDENEWIWNADASLGVTGLNNLVQITKGFEQRSITVTKESATTSSPCS